ncbi:MAG: NAD(P)H-dependent glycerol-3-phosphate dehydrogenase [Chitinophagales bacterium]|nr:NAD(P)H-dependent glycerol-3-phosphate dehydrogenase [Chitinophagales bacterium]MDW8427126.1 NAD(P)H-dependent glycerol-3-phosphate dehydrogenase [Chitinophagales bacterium]
MSATAAMLGGGSWATALVKVLNTNNVRVHWWMRDPAIAHALRTHRHNPRYLSAVEFNPALIEPSTDLLTVVRAAPIVFLAIPSAFVRQVLQQVDPIFLSDKIVVSAIKGMIPEKNELIADFLQRSCRVPESQIVNISGPSHAEEVALEKLTCLTLAARSETTAAQVAPLLRCAYVQCSLSDDLYGTEYSAVLKNIYAIAAGIYIGLDYGDNFIAVFLSNCIEEMERFLRVVQPLTRDIKDSAYLGDLLVTAYSPFSRNRTLGTMLGRGYSVHTSLLQMRMVAEGYYAAACIHQINQRYQVSIPIAEATYKVLYENEDVHRVFGQLSRMVC